jgi:two-component system chemotaxis response regulator CheY
LKVPMKILIVDDDLTSAKLLGHLLKPYGTCITATDGVEALAMVEESYEIHDPFDLIFLDIMMPRINGQEALVEIRHHEQKAGYTNNTKVIMTSALSDADNVMRAFKEKCDAYLVKPISKDSLMDQLKRLGIESPA